MTLGPKTKWKPQRNPMLGPIYLGDGFPQTMPNSAFMPSAARSTWRELGEGPWPSSSLSVTGIVDIVLGLRRVLAVLWSHMLLRRCPECPCDSIGQGTSLGTGFDLGAYGSDLEWLEKRLYACRNVPEIFAAGIGYGRF